MSDPTQSSTPLSSINLNINKYPRIIIQYCHQCKWQNRAIWYLQEFLQTFASSSTLKLKFMILVFNQFLISQESFKSYYKRNPQIIKWRRKSFIEENLKMKRNIIMKIKEISCLMDSLIVNFKEID